MGDDEGIDIQQTTDDVVRRGSGPASCGICGKELRVRQKKFCTRRCAGVSRSDKVPKPYTVIEGFNRTSALNMHREGATDADIASHLEITRRTVGAWRKREGLPQNSRKGRTYATWHYRAALLQDEGRSIKEMVSILGKKRKTITSLLRRLRATGKITIGAPPER